MDRRRFIEAATISGLAACASGAHVGAMENELVGNRDHQEKNSFRTITYNILAAKGYPERKENKTRLQQARRRMPERFALELAVYDPDLVTFQESPAERVVAKIAQQLGMAYTYFAGGFPGTVLTKHKIKSSTNCPAGAGDQHDADLFSRHWGRALLQVNDTELVVFSAHLHPSNKSIHARESDAMLAAMSADLASGKNVILQGDLNDGPENSTMCKKLKEAGLQDAFAAKGSGKGLTCSSTNLRWRIDYVWSAGVISSTISECRVLAEGPFIDHPDDPAGFALSDHLPVMATFSIG